MTVKYTQKFKMSARGSHAEGGFIFNMSPFSEKGDAVADCQLLEAAPNLLKFAELVRDFFSNDSSGHARYLKEQAEIALGNKEVQS